MEQGTERVVGNIYKRQQQQAILTCIVVHSHAMHSIPIFALVITKIQQRKNIIHAYVFMQGVVFIIIPLFPRCHLPTSNTLFHLPLLLYSSTVCPFYPSSKNLHLYGRCHTAALVSVNENKTMSLVSTSFFFQN